MRSQGSPRLLGNKMDYSQLLNLKNNRTLYLTAQDFLNDCASYFTWAQEHPLQEEKVFQFQGEIVRADIGKVRAFSKRGLCNHLGVPEKRLESYVTRGDEWAEAVEIVEQIIFTQKFENAAANLLNSAVIIRDLGMADKQEFSGPNGDPIQTQEVSARDKINRRIAGLATRMGEDADTSGPDGQ